jgi:hypothetical protein
MCRLRHSVTHKEAADADTRRSDEDEEAHEDANRTDVKS